MKIINKIKFAAITLLLLVGSATQALADSWSSIGLRAAVLNPYKNVTSKSFNELNESLIWAEDNSNWWVRPGSGIHWTGDYCVSIRGNYHQTNYYTQVNDLCVAIAIYETTRDIPSYAKLERSVTFQTALTAASTMYHGCGLYLFDDVNTAQTASLDATYTQGRSEGSTYNIVKQFSSNTNSHTESGGVLRTWSYDNHSNAENKDFSKYIALVYSAATESNHRAWQQWAAWQETASDSTWYYYKYLTFDANGGTGNAMAEQTIENSGTLTANSYTRPGYRFIGWNTRTDGNGTAYTDGGTITATLEDKGPVTLYAQWALDLSVPESGYATVFSDKNLVVPAGVEVYSYTYTDGALIQGTKISEGAVLPAYNGYLVKSSAAGTYTFITTSAAATAPSSDVTGTTAEISTPSGAIYVWGRPEGYNYGWYRYTGATIPAGKAYFDISLITNGTGGDVNNMNRNDHKAW